MKLSVTQYSVERWGDEKYKKLREIGFEAIDFSNDITSAHAKCEISNEEFLDAVRRDKVLIDEAGLEVYQMHGPWRWPPQDNLPEDRADRMSRMKASIEGCAILGCKNWIIHNIMPFGHEDLKLDKGEETWEMNREFFRELAKTAHKFDVNICLENMPMPNFSMATPQNLLDFIAFVCGRTLLECNTHSFKRIPINTIRDFIHKLSLCLQERYINFIFRL